MAGYPTHIGRTPINIIFLVLKYIGKGISRVHHIAPVGMHYAFGLTGGTGGIQNKQRVLAVYINRFAGFALTGDGIVPPKVPAFNHLNWISGVFMDDNGLDGFAAELKGFINYLFNWNIFGAAGIVI
jgi:hypothetical protein